MPSLKSTVTLLCVPPMSFSPALMRRIMGSGKMVRRRCASLSSCHSACTKCKAHSRPCRLCPLPVPASALRRFTMQERRLRGPGGSGLGTAGQSLSLCAQRLPSHGGSGRWHGGAKARLEPQLRADARSELVGTQRLSHVVVAAHSEGVDLEERAVPQRAHQVRSP